MIFIETTTFTKLIGSYLTDDEYRGLQGFLLEHPDTAELFAGQAGLESYAGLWPIKEKVAVFGSFTIGNGYIMKYGSSPLMVRVNGIQYRAIY